MKYERFSGLDDLQLRRKRHRVVAGALFAVETLVIVGLNVRADARDRVLRGVRTRNGVVASHDGDGVLAYTRSGDAPDARMLILSKVVPAGIPGSTRSPGR